MGWQVLITAQPAMQPHFWGGTDISLQGVRKASSKGFGDGGPTRRRGQGTLAHQLQGQGCPWALWPQGHITAGIGLGQCCAWKRKMSLQIHTGSSQPLAAGPHFPQVLREGPGSCWGYELNQGSRTPSKDAQHDPITSLFSSTSGHVEPRYVHPGLQPCWRGVGDTHRRDRKYLLD